MQTCPGGLMACIMRSWGSFVLANMDFPPLGESWVCSSAAVVKFRCPPGEGGGSEGVGAGTRHAPPESSKQISVHDIETDGSYA